VLPYRIGHFSKIAGYQVMLGQMSETGKPET
jgi:hypothetical protein